MRAASATTVFNTLRIRVCFGASCCTGKKRDVESGLDYFGAGYNSSSMGRFMSPDPLGGDLTNPQSLSRYSYVLNNPLTNTDLTGMDSWDAKEMVWPRRNCLVGRSRCSGTDGLGKCIDGANDALRRDSQTNYRSPQGSVDVDAAAIALANANIRYLTVGLGITANSQFADPIAAAVNKAFLPEMQQQISYAQQHLSEARSAWIADLLRSNPQSR